MTYRPTNNFSSYLTGGEHSKLQCTPQCTLSSTRLDPTQPMPSRRPFFFSLPLLLSGDWSSGKIRQNYLTEEACVFAKSNIYPQKWFSRSRDGVGVLKEEIVCVRRAWSGALGAGAHGAPK
ncbi:hypothetical protein CDAR_379071 [Caerostris darwini]|uniref:Uncharacterized protein n=1 Tax=Caerostris darwini TaxID=1538125 RepID=A0AAV4TYX8_9ARAC|nr:hypothetical protein CDAR_379071 [Caerostris darwini]